MDSETTHLFEVALNMNLPFSERIKAREQLRASGHGEELSRRLKELTAKMKSDIRKQIGDEKFQVLENIVNSALGAVAKPPKESMH